MAVRGVEGSRNVPVPISHVNHARGQTKARAVKPLATAQQPARPNANQIRIGKTAPAIHQSVGTQLDIKA
jgi:hypothetical protein